ncbi:MAG: Holliday junction branch migration protein RuvA, partial [Pseudomonadota bacterium]
MIASIRGKLVSKQAPEIVIETGGIGYALEVPMSTYFRLPAVGAEASLLTHFLVREDAQLLYGFADAEERDLFRSLLKVSGVGARIALAILSGISVEGFRQCVAFDDTAALIKVPGIGKKTAERVIYEMRDKLDAPAVATPAATMAAGGSAPATADGRAEAFHALVALGYKDAEVRRLLKAVEGTGDAESAEDYIRLAQRQT